MKRLIKISLVSTLAIILSNCSVVEDQNPQNFLPSNTAFSNAAGARAALTGAYDAIQSTNYYGRLYLIFPDLHGTTNLRWTGTFATWAAIGNRGILADNTDVTAMWLQIYQAINRANQIIDKVPAITDPALTDKNGILGEAYFLRAFHYFNLVRYWGGVPLKLTPTDEANISALQLPRSSITEVYAQILADLGQAITLGSAATNRFRARANAFRALKARVHLYRSSPGIALANEWDLAISEATDAGATLPVPATSLVTPFSALFSVKNTVESIWEIPFDPVDNNSIAFHLLPAANGGRNEARPTTGLQGIYATNDTRRITTGSVDASLKYFRPQTNDDNVIVFRNAEMYLIRAEAMVERNTGTDLADAVTIVNALRTRATLPAYSGTVNQASLRDEVFNQRRAELALEGHYFFDIVRTNRVAGILTSPVWDPNQAVLPIPQREIFASPGLVQNPGY
ncbi:MAG: RagB/SusD family nutrient uptake outer membrane protein [Chryseotalea sp. WA131a]|nr:MAG: RagB/SusD family nutrient uptake outer membrane protein [Chryseotalea sp. WA131a]